MICLMNPKSPMVLVSIALFLGLPDLAMAQSYLPEITDAFISSRVIDVSKPVGVIEGTAAVTPTGSASYTIPLMVPPGTNGVQPSVGIDYDSQRGDGIIGWGWALTGVSAISRTGQDWYHDGAVHGVRYGSTDRFAADGQRLVALSGSYGANNTTYDTENASFSVYTSMGTMGSGPAWFSVITQDGTYMEYGATADSRIMGDNGNSVAMWRLNKVMDPHGNYVNYVYDSFDAESRLVRIDYTGNANIGLSPYNRVEFAYQGRLDRNEVFIRGIGGPKTSNLLTTVTIFCEGTVMKTYHFNYSLRNIDKSYLREIGETGADGSNLNTTILKYGEPVAQPFQIEYSSVVQGSGHDFFSGDYDGDGKSEILTSAYAYTNEGYRYNSDLQIYKRVGPNNLQLTWSTPLDPNIQVINDQNVPQTYTANVSNDMNGDGRDDIMLGKVSQVNGYWKLQNFTVLESNSSNASSFATNTYGIPWYNNQPYDIVNPNTFQYQVSGDFNGDGKGDILAFLSNGNFYHGFLYSPSAGIFGQIMSITNGAGDLPKSSFLAPIDFDGDGAHEILSVWGDLSAQQNTRIYRYTTTPVAGFEIVWSSSGFPTPEHELFPGDFNGDGKTDLLNRYSGGGPWHIHYATGALNGDGYYSTGTPFAQFNAYVNLGGTPDVLAVADFNGDGKSDICHGRNVGGVSSVLDVFHSRGMHSDFKEVSYPHSSLLGWSPALITDLDGDGRSEVINTTNIFDPIEIYFFDRGGHERLAHKVVNGMGARKEFTYGYMTDPTLHNRGTAFDYPMGDAQLPFALVRTSSATNGIGSMNPVSYSYGNAVLNRTGRGFVGFKQTFIADPITNRIVIDQFGAQPDYAELYPASSQVYRFDIPGSLISNTAYAFDFVPIGIPALRRHLIRSVSTIAFDALASTTTTTINSAWNACGKVTATATDINGLLNSTTTTTYTAAGPSAQPVKPQEVTITTTRSGQPSVTKTNYFQYFAATGKVEFATEFSGTPGASTTAFEYYAAGPPLRRSMWYPLLNAAQRPVQEFRYDTKYRFITWHTNVWNDNGNFIDVNTYTVTDPRWGQPIEVYSSDGLTTLREYDAFGRLTRNYVPHIAGTPRYSVDMSREWAIDGFYEYTVLLTSDPGGPDAEVYLDILGRPVRTVRESYGHETVSSATGYDARGNRAWETTPHKDTEQFLTIEHTYDAYNRPHEVINPFTGTQQYAYSYSGGSLHLTATNTSSGQWSTVITDATGKKVRSLDDGGELKYTYDSWGQVKRVHHDGLLTLRNEYDAFGRQELLWAPNAGTTRYKYNPFGQLTWQKNGNGHETTLEYDNLGRVVKRIDPNGTTVYTYFNDNGYINNNLVTVAGPTVERAYRYDDPYHRLTARESTINGQLYAFGYEYDDYDRVTATFYPSALEVWNEYDEAGSLQRVSWSGGTLFEGSTKNGLEQYTGFTLADGNSVGKEYEHGFLTRIQGGAVQDLRMKYDYSTGDMRYRWDPNKFVMESFEYDELSRLIKSSVFAVDANGNPTGLGFVPTEYGYDGSIGSTRGNLTKNTDVGQFGFGNHAVVAAKHIDYPTPYDQPPYQISLETQEISYTSFSKADRITEVVGADNYELQYEYGPEYERTRSLLSRNGNTETTRVYLDGYETQETNGQVELIHYIQGGDGLCAIMVNTNGVWKTYPTYLDHLGSIVTVTDADNGNVVAVQNFDPWGNHRNPASWGPNFTPTLPSWLYRGFTGHEHVAPFALINMNGRMYDHLNGRMLSADNYINGSSATQSFNRYTYAANNPLKYTDPSGDFLAVPFFAIGMIADYTSNLIHGESDPLGKAYNNVSASMSGISNCLKINTQVGENTYTSVGIDPFSLSVGVWFTYKEGDFAISGGMAIGLGGSVPGTESLTVSGNAGLNASYDLGDFTIGASAGIGPDGSTRVGAGAGYKGHSFGVTHFGGKDPQWNWVVGFKGKGWGFSVTNDFLIDGDWYRTAAAEVSIGQYSIGFNLYTGKPPASERAREIGGDVLFRSMWEKLFNFIHHNYTYSSGDRKHAFLYASYTDGFTVSRIGVDAPFVQDATQNLLHSIINTPYFNPNLGVNGSGARPFSQWIGYNPWTLY